MKKVLFPLLAVVVMTTGCNQNKNASGNEAATPSDSTTTSSTTISEGMIAYVKIFRPSTNPKPKKPTTN